MNKLYLLLGILLLSIPLAAQTDYVANTTSGSSAAPFNTLVGAQAGFNINASGQSNVFTGYQSGYSSTSGMSIPA